MISIDIIFACSTRSSNNIYIYYKVMYVKTLGKSNYYTQSYCKEKYTNILNYMYWNNNITKGKKYIYGSTIELGHEQ